MNDGNTYDSLFGVEHLYVFCRRLRFRGTQKYVGDADFAGTDVECCGYQRYLFPEAFEGFFFTLFAIGIAAAETALAIAIIINIFRHIQNVEVRNLDKMKF